MRALITSLNWGRLASSVHSLLKLLLPVSAFVLVSVDLVILAFLLVLLAKWRVLAVKMRYWGINIRSNLVDVIVGFAVVEFMSQTPIQGRLSWLVFYIVWAFFIKRLSSYNGAAIQAFIAQVLGVSALFYSFQAFDLAPMMVAVWFISHSSAQHVLNIANDNQSGIAHVWGLFSLQLVWILYHWQTWYWIVPQFVLLQAILFLPLAYLYTMYKSKTLTRFILRVTTISMTVSVLAVLILADWQDKVV